MSSVSSFVPWVGFTPSSFRALARFSARLAVGEKPVVTDAVKATRQDVDEEPADKLGGFERHRLVAVFLLSPVILPLKGHAVFIEVDEA